MVLGSVVLVVITGVGDEACGSSCAGRRGRAGGRSSLYKSGGFYLLGKLVL